MNARNKMIVDLRRHSHRLDALARALDQGRGPGWMKDIRQQFAELTKAMHKDAARRNTSRRQLTLFDE